MKKLQQLVKEQKEIIFKQNNDIQTLMKTKAKLQKDVNELQLEIISLQHKITKLQTDAADNKDQVSIRRFIYICLSYRDLFSILNFPVCSIVMLNICYRNSSILSYEPTLVFLC